MLAVLLGGSFQSYFFSIGYQLWFWFGEHGVVLFGFSLLLICITISARNLSVVSAGLGSCSSDLDYWYNTGSFRISIQSQVCAVLVVLYSGE